jgi:N-acetylglucosamine kinase-like BadF-type ATPase
LVGESGNIVGHAVGTSCNFTDLGVEGAKTELARLWSKAWNKAGMNPRPADAVFMGLGSILSPRDAEINCEMAVEIGLADAGAVFAGNDAWNAHAAGLLGSHGILLMAGTGSACLGRNHRNENWRAGGWGHLLNERGSAYALGQAALVAATRDADGRGEPTGLKALVCDVLELGDLKEMFYKVHHIGVPRADIAALAPRVVALADEGDNVARRILADEADGLVEMVVTVARRLKLDSPELALTGGLINNATNYRGVFLGGLARKLPGFRLVEDGLAPVFGAVLLAVERGTGSVPAISFVETLHRNSANFPNLQC